MNRKYFKSLVNKLGNLDQAAKLAEKLATLQLDEAQFAEFDELLGKKIVELEAMQPAPVQVKVDHQYGVRPKKAGKCRVVWEFLDAMVEAGNVPVVADAKKFACDQDLNMNNCVTEFYSWRKAHQAAV